MIILQVFWFYNIILYFTISGVKAQLTNKFYKMRELTWNQFGKCYCDYYSNPIRPWFSCLKHGEMHPENWNGHLVTCTIFFLLRVVI